MHRLDFTALTKSYGSVTAVDSLTARVEPGRITAFLGANGSGKTTSMRVLLGLAEPTAGTATIDGNSYRELDHPLKTVGAVLDQGFHPGRTARNHLRIVAAQAGAPAERIDLLLDSVGLGDAARRRVGGFSLGMRQRLALASALVGDPSVLVLDEPFNGLDPNGIQAMRILLRRFADDGGTSCCPATCSPRSRSAPMMRSSSITAGFWPSDRWPRSCPADRPYWSLRPTPTCWPSHSPTAAAPWNGSRPNRSG